MRKAFSDFKTEFWDEGSKFGKFVAVYITVWVLAYVVYTPFFFGLLPMSKTAVDAIGAGSAFGFWGLILQAIYVFLHVLFTRGRSLMEKDSL